MRGNMAKALRGDEHIKRVWTMDGEIFSAMDERGQEVKKRDQYPSRPADSWLD